GATPDGLLQRRFYPLSRHFTAFDLMITEAGYNSFHEATLSGTPAIFIPRNTPGVDDQSLRARYAVSAGLGFALERHETARLDPLLERALDPASAAEIARRAARLAMPNGAVEAAGFIVETAMMLRADRPLGSAVNR
ncbi:MAG TPA: glycosyltransferase, partial [Methylomirabilota bacterium]|nr:glycosyltransferase [Methylomirabilota bacterium]